MSKLIDISLLATELDAQIKKMISLYNTNIHDNDRIKKIQMIKDVIKNIKYKPNCSFRYTEYPYSNIVRIFMNILTIEANAFSEGVQTSVPLTNFRDVNLSTLEDQFQVINIIKEMIIETELHEAAEFFKYKNDYIIHPHPANSIIGILR